MYRRPDLSCNHTHALRASYRPHHSSRSLSYSATHCSRGSGGSGRHRCMSLFYRPLCCILILERISLRVRHSGHIQIVIVLKLLLLVLQVRHRNDVVVLIICSFKKSKKTGTPSNIPVSPKSLNLHTSCMHVSAFVSVCFVCGIPDDALSYIFCMTVKFNPALCVTEMSITCL